VAAPSDPSSFTPLLIFMVFEMAEATRVQPSGTVPRQLEDLEERVRQLEDTIAAMHDTRLLEERVAERVAERIHGNLTPAPSSAAGILIDAGPHLFPVAADSMNNEFAYPGASTPVDSGRRPPWLLLEIYEEFRAIYWMFLDPRYRLSWTGRIAPLAILFVLFSSWLFLGSFPWSLIDKILSIVFIVVLYKVLSREARRYRQIAPRFSSRAPH
jgi:hypothetical protein